MAMENVFQKEVAERIVGAIRKVYPDNIAAITALLDINEIELGTFICSKIETPKDSKLGDLAFPAFLLAKPLKEKPPIIAQKIVESLASNDVVATGPYVNFTLSTPRIAGRVLPDIYLADDKYGSQTIGQGKNIVIDYSSPNIAKPFGIGHLRSTTIGGALYRIYEKLGYKSIGINHLGDWGTQFGKVITAYKKWGDPEEIKNDPIPALLDLYVRFNNEEKKNPELSELARATFKKLEDGDSETVELWKLFKDYSLEEFKRIYDLLGVKFDYYTGESFYNNKMDAVIERLKIAGLATESQGALVVDLEKYNMPACLLRKADGATLYSTRDLAGMTYRFNTYNFEKALYVVGTAQSEHFRQIFKVAEMLGEPYADRLVHVEFGWIRFDKKAMATRTGNIILLDDVIQTAFEKAKKIILDKNPELPNIDETARTIAIGAIIFADLGVKRHKDVDFSWDEVLSFEGETGPYLQYTHARLCALQHKYGKDVDSDVDYELYDSTEEKALLLHLYRFGQIVEIAAEKYEPNYISEYLLELAAIFNRFYQRKDSKGKLIKIISEDQENTRARMLLVWAVKAVLKEGLRLLGIKAPQEM